VIVADTASGDGNPIRVLVVDDHAVVRAGLEQLLATAADVLLVGTASDGVDAEPAVAEHAPDVVLMDLSMPQVDGVEATRRVKAAHPGVHVVVLTSLADQDSIMDAIDAGAEGYLFKHAAPDEILDAIRTVVNGGAPLDPKAARVLLTGRRAAPAAAPSLLRAREEEVLRLVAEGLANKQIARKLAISERTVKAHLTSIFQRIGVSDRTQAALWARDHLQS
jgi:DNA-binding NarL/FixJ family response regulator